MIEWSLTIECNANVLFLIITQILLTGIKKAIKNLIFIAFNYCILFEHFLLVNFKFLTCKHYWRRTRDSNSRRVAPYTLSRRAPSATRPILHKTFNAYKSHNKYTCNYQALRMIVNSVH